MATISRPLAIVGALCIAATTFRAAEPRTDAFSVGVMRRDGFLVPFAAFNGKRWLAIWVAPQIQLEIPINLQSVPKSWWGPNPAQAEWQLWPASVDGGGDARAVRAAQPDWVQAHCVRQIALRTDYRSERPAAPPTAQPYPKDGLAVAPPRAIERIESIPVASTEATEMQGAVAAAFDRAERETAQRFHHPVKERTREGVAVTLEAVYAYGASPRLYYVESSRAYRTPGSGDDGCAIAFGTGWFMKDRAAAPKTLDMAVDVLPCNKYGATYMLPLGVLRAEGRAFWIAQYAGWDHERYMVIEIKKNNIAALVGVWGGGC